MVVSVKSSEVGSPGVVDVISLNVRVLALISDSVLVDVTVTCVVELVIHWIVLVLFHER
jgi:hypothetical protein